jgi:recombination protein RecT
MSTTTNNNMNGTNLPATQPAKASDKMTLLKNFFEKDLVKAQMSNALKDNQDSFVASVIDLYSGDTYLQNCHPELVAMQALKAAVLNLPVIKSLGFAYIVPFKSGDKFLPQLIIGYKGLIQLAIRTNQYEIIHADSVYEGEYRSSSKLTGEFDLDGHKKSDVVIGYFAHFRMKNGFSKTLYMTKERVTAHAAKYSKSYSQPNGPWKTEFDAMAKKTVLRGLLTHWGYMSVEMMDTFTEEDADVATRVMNEISSNANTTDAGFEDVTNNQTAESGEAAPY